MERILHNLIQGSDEWNQFRLEHDGASEAVFALGIKTKRGTRNELLRIKHTGIAKEFSAWVQENVLDRGHEIEALTRPMVEALIGESLYPVTYSYGRLSASCDGLTADDETAFECKQWNEALAEAVRRKELPEEHQPQCQQVMHVNGAKRLIFAVSDGTPDKFEWMEVLPDPAWVARIIAGWAQFNKDLAEYVPQEVIPAVVAAPQMALPSVSVQVHGSIAIRDNLSAFGDALTAYVARINKKPETDQDFADLEASVKTLKEAEEKLEAAKNGALGQVESIDLMKRTADQLQELARTNRLVIEKLVKAEKENRRNAHIRRGIDALADHVAALNSRLGKPYMPQIVADFAGKVKGLKSIDSIKNAVDTELARCKIDANAVADKIDANLKTLRELATDHTFLFADTAQIVQKSNDDLTALVKMRIAEHKARTEAEERAKIESQQRETAPPTTNPEPSKEDSGAAPVAAPATVSTFSARRKMRPTDDEIIGALSLHFRVHESKVIEWLLEMDLQSAGARLIA